MEVNILFEYIVQPGDYLYRIADMFDVSVASILAANPGLTPYNIYPGLVKLIPLSRSFI
jgi:LysM repeat protein